MNYEEFNCVSNLSVIIFLMLTTLLCFVAFCIGLAGAFGQDNGAAKSEADPVAGRWKVSGISFWEFHPDGTIQLFENNGEAP